MYHKPTYWNRKLLNFLWVGVFVSFILPIINYLFTDLTLQDYLFYRMGVPLGFEIIIMLILEFLNQYNYRMNDYIIILSSIAIIVVLNIVHMSVNYVVLPLFYVPVFIAVFMIGYKKIIFSCVMSTLCFLALNSIHSAMKYDFSESITFVFILSSAGYLSFELTRRYKDIYEDLQVSISNEQDLFYKNIFMEKLSKMDLPTNLYNHKTFHNYLEELFLQFQKQPFELHLALLDLDNFKQINDVYGHSKGDVVIKRMADIILDSMDSHGFAARYGGEEFAIIFIENNKKQCFEILEKIRQEIEDHNFYEIKGNNVTVSIGFASCKACDSKEALFKLADKYLYKAKNNGKNQVYSI